MAAGMNAERTGSEGSEAAGARALALLGLLRRAEGHGVAEERLIAALWPAEPPDALEQLRRTALLAQTMLQGGASVAYSATARAYRLVQGEVATPAGARRVEATAGPLRFHAVACCPTCGTVFVPRQAALT